MHLKAGKILTSHKTDERNFKARRTSVTNSYIRTIVSDGLKGRFCFLPL